MTQVATTTATYDLMLLLETEREESIRHAVLDSALKAIERDGELLRHDRWGVRELAYPIKHHTSAEYHLLQFRPAGRELLQELERSLRIAEGVLRFRIVKLAPGTPEPPVMHAPTAAAGAPAPATAQEPPASTAAPAAPLESRTLADQVAEQDPQVGDGADPAAASAASANEPAAQQSADPGEPGAGPDQPSADLAEPGTAPEQPSAQSENG